MKALRYLAALPLAILLADSSRAADYVVVERDGKRESLVGRVLVEAEDGGLLFLATDGVMWVVQPDEKASRSRDDAPIPFLDRDAMARALVAEMPAGFQAKQTAHYVICYNTSPAYADWCGALYERLYRAFYNYWSNRGFKLREPEVPLVALVFNDKASYAAYARAEVGKATDSIIGYYSLRSNRVTMYDLTGIQAIGGVPGARSSAAEINAILSRPEAERTVATIVHEATHQLAFNSGLMARFADVPLWYSEGLAMFFETPDLKSSQGWRSVGAVNRVQLAQFHQYVARRPADSLVTLLADNARYSEARQAADAYAEAWALHFFLIRSRPREYLTYLKTLSEKAPLGEDKPEDRLRQFQSAFGDLKQLDADFVRTMAAIR
jgi:hypothetical protein